MTVQSIPKKKFEKLKGRENYDSWKVSAKSYLVIKDLWSVIEKDISPDDSPETNGRAISEITLMIQPSLYSYIPETKNAFEVWKSLEKAFDDSGVTRKVTILNQLVSIKLRAEKNIESYVNKILLYWLKSKVVGFKIDEDVIASLMLGGLPDEFRPMILGIENSGHELTVDYVKMILLQGVQDIVEEKRENVAMIACTRRCFKCGDTMHIVINCPKKNWKCSVCGSKRHLTRNCTSKQENRDEEEKKEKPEEENKPESITL